jgi:hypothetical protein
MAPTVNKTQKSEAKDKVNYGVLRCATVLEHRRWKFQAARELEKEKNKIYISWQEKTTKMLWK